jgi:hypothetical protein
MIRQFTPHQALLLGFYSGFMLLISGCAWIPSGDKPAEFLKTPPMEHTLSDTGHGVPLAPAGTQRLDGYRPKG